MRRHACRLTCMQTRGTHSSSVGVLITLPPPSSASVLEPASRLASGSFFTLVVVVVVVVVLVFFFVLLFFPALALAAPPPSVPAAVPTAAPGKWRLVLGKVPGQWRSSTTTHHARYTLIARMAKPYHVQHTAITVSARTQHKHPTNTRRETNAVIQLAANLSD